MILEVQRRIDERKRLTWFDYLASARRRGPACVVVITTSTRVAAWAVQPLSLGPRKEEQRMGIVTRREILLKQLSARGFTVTAAQRRLVEACNNKRTLDRWLGRIVTATSARAVFAPPRPRTPRSS